MKYVRQFFIIIYVAMDVGLVSMLLFCWLHDYTKGSQVDDNSGRAAIIGFRSNQISNKTGKECCINKSRQSLITIRSRWRSLTVDESVHTPAGRSLPSLYVLNATATKLHDIYRTFDIRTGWIQCRRCINK
jgi:hypothetical protein